MKRLQRMIVACLTCALLVSQISGAVFASSAIDVIPTPAVNKAALAPGISSYGTLLTQEELEDIEGGWGPIITGAISGAVCSAVTYALVAEEPTLQGAAIEAAKGAAWGAISGGFQTAGAIVMDGDITFDATKAFLTTVFNATVNVYRTAVDTLFGGSK